MAGANYTGGKRNAVKARSKDIASRLRRDHFGKQKLSILSNKSIDSQNETNSLRTMIELKHARLNQRGERTPEKSSSSSRIPKPILLSDLRSDSSVSETSRSSKSKALGIIKAFDLLEPISFASMKRKLLGKTDLAGLSRKKARLSERSSPAPCQAISSNKHKPRPASFTTSPRTHHKVSIPPSSDRNSSRSSKSSSIDSFLLPTAHNDFSDDISTADSDYGSPSAQPHPRPTSSSVDYPRMRSCSRISEAASSPARDSQLPSSDLHEEDFSINPALVDWSEEWLGFADQLHLKTPPPRKLYVNIMPSKPLAGIDFYALLTTDDKYSDLIRDSDRDVASLERISSLMESAACPKPTINSEDNGAPIDPNSSPKRNTPLGASHSFDPPTSYSPPYSPYSSPTTFPDLLDFPVSPVHEFASLTVFENPLASILEEYCSESALSPDESLGLPSIFSSLEDGRQDLFASDVCQIGRDSSLPAALISLGLIQEGKEDSHFPNGELLGTDGPVSPTCEINNKISFPSTSNPQCSPAIDKCPSGSFSPLQRLSATLDHAPDSNRIASELLYSPLLSQYVNPAIQPEEEQETGRSQSGQSGLFEGPLLFNWDWDSIEGEY